MRASGRRRLIAIGLIACCALAVAVALAASGNSGSGEVELEAAAGPGRALPDGEAPVESAAATMAESDSLPESTVDSDPGTLQLRKAGSEVFDVRDLESTVIKQERPEREPPFGLGEGECAEAEESECGEQAEEGAEASADPTEAIADGQSIPPPKAPAPAADASFDGLDFATWGAGPRPTPTATSAPTTTSRPSTRRSGSSTSPPAIRSRP